MPDTICLRLLPLVDGKSAAAGAAARTGCATFFVASFPQPATADGTAASSTTAARDRRKFTPEG